MFLKQIKVKSNVPLKGSDTKRLRQRLELAFPTMMPKQHEKLLPPKSNVSAVKLVTHSDFHTIVYCVDKVVMLFEIEGNRLVPTLYALWLVPKLLPYFTAHKDVLPRLSGGADLMLPGVMPQGTGMDMYGRYQKDQLVAINLTSNRAAMAVGYLIRSSDDLYMNGGQGSAVKMLHIFGDKLWGFEPTLTQQAPNWKPANLTSDDCHALGGSDKRVKPKDTPPQTLANVVSASADDVQNFPQLPCLNTLEINNDDELSSSEAKEEKSMSNTAVVGGDALTIDERSEPTAEEVLKSAFLAVLKKNGKTLQLPLLTSNFYRLHVVPEASTPIDIKKTKYNKLSNFLNEMMNEGFIVVREETKGIDKITQVNLDHPEVVNFIVDFKPKKSSANDADAVEQPLFHTELSELYVVTDATAAFFTKLNYKRGEGIPIHQIEKIVREYINKQDLTISNILTKSIQLDDTLQQICECETASLQAIRNAIISKMEHSYQMVTMKDVPSNKPLIELFISRRSGNKTVTLVRNLQCYGIVLPEFIKLCKQGAAASTTIVKLPNQEREQLQIQGNQVRFVHNLLTDTYKVPPKYILEPNLAQKEKELLIGMSISRRSANEKVTIVSNLECYGIVLPEFIKLCKQGTAGSITIVKLPNQEREHLQIQGNQLRFVHNLLTNTYKIPPKYITGLKLNQNEQKQKNSRNSRFNRKVQKEKQKK